MKRPLLQLVAINYKDPAGDANIPEAVVDMQQMTQVAKSISDNVILWWAWSQIPDMPAKLTSPVS